MEYNQKTQDLIDRQCRNVEREGFTLNKKEVEKLVLASYDLFKLEKPKKIVWCKDIFEKRFLDSARSAWSAGSAGSAWSAGSAGSAWSAGSAGSARSAWSARSAGSAWSASYLEWTALDYDFDWYIFEFEYCLNPDSDKQPNNNDKIYLEYCELLMQAKEAGLGYWVEWEGVLYLAPTPIVKLDERNRYHSTKTPAIYWKGGEEFYYINSVSFKKELWKKITGGKIKAKEVFKIQNTEQRRIAYELMDKSKMKELNDFKTLDEGTDKSGNPHKVVSFTVKGYDEPFTYYNCFCPSTGREYFLQTEKETCAEAKQASFGLSDAEFIKEW